MPTLTIEVTDSTLQALRSDAKRKPGVKPENLAAAAVEDYVRTSILFDRRFADARREVDRRLATA